MRAAAIAGLALVLASAITVLLRLAGRRPDPDVDDATLADRIRSELGPVEKSLDLPHIHVTVERHVAHLHGDVRWPREAATLERAVRAVSGVRDVRSHLHLGLLPSDTPPSRGRAVRQPPSAIKTQMLASVHEAGAAEDDAETVVGATLSVFTARIAEDERRQVIAHLPADVRALVRATGDSTTADIRTWDDLVEAIRAQGAREVDAAEVRAVLRELGRAVPEEVHDIAAVLPRHLRNIWSALSPL